MDNRELFEALALLEKERGIPQDYMLTQIQKAIVIACKNTYGGNEDVKIVMDKDTGDFEVTLFKTVVEDIEDPDFEISAEKAREIDPTAAVGEKVGLALDPKQFGRIAVQTSRSIIRQGIRDGEKGQMLQEFQSRVQELVTATVERIDPRTGNVTLKIGKAEAVLPKSEQVGEEAFTEGEHIKVYIVDVREGEKGRARSFPVHIPILSSACLKQRSRRFSTVQSKSSPFPGKRAPAQSLRSGARTATSTRLVRASAQGAPESARL